MAVSRVTRFLVGGAFWLAAAAPLSAATVTVGWDPNPESDVSGYNVYVTTNPGVWGSPIGIGNRTNWTFTGLADNAQYYFAVQALSPSGGSPLAQIGYHTPTRNLPGSEASRSDFNGDGLYDILWHHPPTGALVAWHLNGFTVTASRFLSPAAIAAGWILSGSGDFNQDGKPDLIWHNTNTGHVVYWLMDGVLNYSAGYLPGPVDPTWRVASIRDLDGDGNPDIWWHNRVTGALLVWYFNGTTFLRSATPSPGLISDTNWKLKATADFTGDGRPDALWHNEASGEIRLWQLFGITAGAVLSPNPRFVGGGWKIASVGDTNRDGWPDILWRHDTSGQSVMWLMQGMNILAADYLSIPATDPAWKILGPR